MAIVAKTEEIPPQAPDGQHTAVCCDVDDLGMCTQEWEGKERVLHKIKVWFQIGNTGPDGKRVLVGKRMTLSMHEKATLRAFLSSWRGKEYTNAEAAGGIDVELMLRVPALIQTTVNERGYADISSIMRLPKGMPELEVEDFVRFRDRPTRTPPASFTDRPEALDEGDEDLPF